MVKDIKIQFHLRTFLSYMFIGNELMELGNNWIYIVYNLYVSQLIYNCLLNYV